MAHQLVFKSETGKSRTYPVAGGRITIGRHPHNTIVLDHECVSVYHAEVLVEKGKTLLRDLKSSNGTKVNRKPVSEITLAEGDEIRFGAIVCHLRGEIWFEESNGAEKDEPRKKEAPKQKSLKPGVLKTVAPKAAPPKKIAVKKDTPKRELPKRDAPKTDAPKPPATKGEAPKKITVRKGPPPIEHPPEPEEPLTFLQRLQQHIGESRYFMLSLVIHSVIVILAGGIVLYKAATEPPDFVAEGSAGLIASTDDLSPPPETPADTVPVEPVVQPTPNMNAPRVDVITTSAPSSNFKIPGPQMKITPDITTLTRTRAFSTNLPGTMGGRVGYARSKAMALNKMKAKSEQAVKKGLVWLMLNQNEDGSWGDEFKGAMTGFGLLCFLGHGELQDSPQFGPTVGKALTWLFENGLKHKGRLNMRDAFDQPGVYEHAIAAYALGEYYTMTRDKRVIELLRQAIGYIIEGQSGSGGWMYAYDKSEDDLSVSGWQIQALKAAHLSQLNISDVDKALDSAMKYIERVRGPNGGYGYRGPGDEYSLTGVGILCQLFWQPDRATLHKGMEWMLEQTEKNKPVKYRENSADLYAWYYHTQACLMFGGEAWTKWNGWFQDEICDVQNPDGSWPIPGGGSVGPQYGDNITGAVYRTSLCILMLEVLYRYMPTTQG